MRDLVERLFEIAADGEQTGEEEQERGRGAAIADIGGPSMDVPGMRLQYAAGREDTVMATAAPEQSENGKGRLEKLQ